MPTQASIKIPRLWIWVFIILSVVASIAITVDESIKKKRAEEVVYFKAQTDGQTYAKVLGRALYAGEKSNSIYFTYISLANQYEQRFNCDSSFDYNTCAQQAWGAAYAHCSRDFDVSILEVNRIYQIIKGYESLLWGIDDDFLDEIRAYDYGFREENGQWYWMDTPVNMGKQIGFYENWSWVDKAKRKYIENNVGEYVTLIDE